MFAAKNLNDFYWGYSSLKSIDLTNLNAPKEENMKGMFYYCESLESLNLILILKT